MVTKTYDFKQYAMYVSALKQLKTVSPIYIYIYIYIYTHTHTHPSLALHLYALMPVAITSLLNLHLVFSA